MWAPLYRRNDGSFVVRLANGWPYHVEHGDPIYAAVSAAATGATLPPEPPPPYIPPPPPQASSLEFLGLFTRAERRALRAAGKTNDDVEDWLDMLRSAQTVLLEDPRTIGGVAFIQSLGIITPTRAAMILAGTPPV